MKRWLKERTKRAVRRITRKQAAVSGIDAELYSLRGMAQTNAAFSMLRHYPSLIVNPEEEPLAPYEFKVYSQNGEDGVLGWILSTIGIHDYRFVEFGIEDGTECVSALLSLHCGWRGLLMDCDEDNVQAARRYYSARLQGHADRVSIKQAFVTRDNINSLLTEAGVSGEIDLLVIDIDGNDYWVWEALEAIDPRVVVIEYNASFGRHQAVTIPYQAHFDRMTAHPSGFYHGASLAALELLGRKKGYGLAGCESNGVNAFFVKRELMREPLNELTAGEAFYPHYGRLHRGFSQDEQWKMVSQLPLVEIASEEEA